MGNINRQMEQEEEKYSKKIKELKEYNPELFNELEKYLNKLYDKNTKHMKHEKLMQLIGIVGELDNYQYDQTYEANIHTDNFDKVYKKYYEEISKDKMDFYKDILYLYRWRFISVATESFVKSNNTISTFMFHTPIKILDLIIRSDNITENGTTDFIGFIYFTNQGTSLYQGEFEKYLLDKALVQQDIIDGKISELNDMYLELDNRIKDYSKEIISIISIILAIAPIVAINITELKQFNMQRILVINGSLITAITTIFLAVNFAFFEFRAKKLLLLIPIAIGIILIILG